MNVDKLIAKCVEWKSLWVLAVSMLNLSCLYECEQTNCKTTVLGGTLCGFCELSLSCLCECGQTVRKTAVLGGTLCGFWLCE